MKKAVILMLLLGTLIPAFAQDTLMHLIARIEKSAVEIDSLKKVIKTEIDNRQQLSKESNNLHDTLKKLKYELIKLEEFKTEKKKIDSLLRQKVDTISSLKAVLIEKEKQVTAEKQIGEQKAKEENEKGKNEILAAIVNTYKNKSFDELLNSSTQQSAQRDLQLFQDQKEVKQVLSDMNKYFNAKGLLNIKLDIAQIENVQTQLGQIKWESLLLVKLKELLINYRTYNDGLKETIAKIMALDSTKIASGNKEIQKMKLAEIQAGFSSYIFNYDFNFLDYPYLANIFLEIIKRKQPNPDADISDLLHKL